MSEITEGGNTKTEKALELEQVVSANSAGPHHLIDSPVQEEMPLALVDGKPWKDVPQDLFIPPDALSIILESFEGPLDLLLYLIRRQNMDFLSIGVCEITRQYMEYINLAKSMKFELAAEYLLMAAMLAEIKSRMLLPKPSSDEETEDDPRAELIRRLQQYERYKKAAEDIDAMPRMHREIYNVKTETDRSEFKKAETEVSLESVEKLMRSKVKVHKAEIKEKLQELDAANLAAMAEEDYADFYEFLTEL